MESVRHDDEVPSTSCAEDAPLVLEAPSRARLVRKVAALATGTALVAAAGASWTRGGVFGDNVTALQVDFPPKYATYGSLGATNWDKISYYQDVVASEQVCRERCMADTKCTAYNWQQTACQDGWAKDNGCMLFDGSPVTEPNECWSMNYKLSYA